jgi:hypothetical protein
MIFAPSRRQVLRTMGTGFGMAGLAGILNATQTAETPAPMAPKAPHFPATAKHVIFLFLNGGPSQVDTFDPKPMLQKYSGQPIPSGNLKTERKTGNLFGSPFAFRRCGKSGIEISEIFPKLGDSIDDVCVIRSMYTEIPNHEPSLFLMNCGHRVPGRPSMGSWLTYDSARKTRTCRALSSCARATPSWGRNCGVPRSSRRSTRALTSRTARRRPTN